MCDFIYSMVIVIIYSTMGFKHIVDKELDKLAALTGISAETIKV